MCYHVPEIKQKKSRMCLSTFGTLEHWVNNFTTHVLYSMSNKKTINLSNEQFLITIFGSRWVYAHVCSFPDDPTNIPNDRRGICWGGGYLYQKGILPRTNQYFTVSLFEPEHGKSKRRKVNFAGQYCIVLDDVVEKLSLVAANKLPRPNWIMKTSEGSYQWGYILDEPCYNQKWLNNLNDGLIASELAPDSKDPGQKGVTRYVRLPEGINTKSNKIINGIIPEVELEHWDPFTRHKIQSLAIPFHIDLEQERRDSIQSAASVKAMPDHPIFRYVNLKHDRRGGKYEVTCPWIDDHTSNVDADGTVIYTRDDYSIGFMCHHGHCEDKTGADVIKVISQQNKEFSSEYSTWKAKKIWENFKAEQIPNIDHSSDLVISPYSQRVSLSKTDIDEGLDGLVAELPIPKLVDLNVLGSAWRHCYESKSNNKINIIKPDGTYHSQPRNNSYALINIAFGRFILPNDTRSHFASVGTDAEVTKACKDYEKSVVGLFFNYVTRFKQVDSVSFDVDLFIDESTLSVTRDVATITRGRAILSGKIAVSYELESKILNDFRAHFPGFDDYLLMIAASRFARDRRHAGVWIHAGSGWGKSFLLEIFRNLGLVAEVNEQQVKACCSGSPVALSAGYFLNSWILLFDEFKSVNADMKRINNTLSLSPKNQLVCEVPVYNKTFLSAELVGSLVGEYGVETQFAERIAYMQVGNDQLNNRLVYNEHRRVYLDALTQYVARYLNEYVEQMRELGREEAANLSTDRIEWFHQKYHMNNIFESISQGIDHIVTDIYQLLTKFADPMAALSESESQLKRILMPEYVHGSITDVGTVAIVKKPYKVIERFIDHQVPSAERRSIQLKKREILAKLDPNHDQVRRLKQALKSTTQRGVMIKVDQ